MGTEYDVETDAMKETFTRGEDCLECVRQISRCALWCYYPTPVVQALTNERARARLFRERGVRNLFV